MNWQLNRKMNKEYEKAVCEKDKSAQPTNIQKDV